jgi:hypothetical protein
MAIGLPHKSKWMCRSWKHPKIDEPAKPTTTTEFTHPMQHPSTSWIEASGESSLNQISHCVHITSCIDLSQAGTIAS